MRGKEERRSNILREETKGENQRKKTEVSGYKIFDDGRREVI